MSERPLDDRQRGGVESEPLANGPAPQERPGPWHQEVSPDARSTLLTPEALAFAPEVQQAQRALVKDKAYRSTPVGGEVGRFLRSLRWSEKSQHTLDSYETTLARLSYDYAHLQTLEEFDTEIVRDFPDLHWGESKPTTRRQRLACLNSFFDWAVDERGLTANPAKKIKPPKRNDVERQAYAPVVIEKLRRTQPTLRDQIAIQLLGRVALRRNEMRLIQVGDFDLGKGTFLVHGKGGKAVVLPIGFTDLKADLELHLIGRDPAEYLLYPKNDPTRPMESSSVHRWFKKALERAGLPSTIKMHELRHSAADNLWRETGDLMLAQQLLRHESVSTTQAYLHPTRDDLADALAGLQVLRSSESESE